MELISSIQWPCLMEQDIQLDLLRIDVLHPEISGNKWFKLKYNITYALEHNYNTLISFGGAYSNHLHALAYAGFEAGLKTIGIVRGEPVDNPTLSDCVRWGMELQFISREKYKQKKEPHYLEELQHAYPHAMLIPEGGSNDLGLKGCTEIISITDTTCYDVFACAIGTGTTFCGIANALLPHQDALGYTALKQGEYLKETFEKEISHPRWQLQTEAHCGGFGKRNQELLDFMARFQAEQHIELDVVYTGKMCLGLQKDIEQNRFRHGTKILAIHTGGLQGNRTLAC